MARFGARLLAASLGAYVGFAANSGGLDLDGALALVQANLQLHEELSRASVMDKSKELVEGEAEWPTDPAEWIVDNSELQHKGPGVMWRSSENVEATLGDDQYVPWNTTITGRQTESGKWVKVGEKYLPRQVHGFNVVLRKYPMMKLTFNYLPTYLKGPANRRIPCNITGLGKSPNSFDVMVTSDTMAAYPIMDVPDVYLEKITKVRNFVPLPIQGLAHKKKMPEDSPIKVQVHYRGSDFALTFLRKSPLRTMMNLACDKAKIPLEGCLNTVHFEYKNQILNPVDKYGDVDLEDNADIAMYRGPAPNNALPKSMLPVQ